MHHVVCHDCDFERLVTGNQKTRDIVASHLVANDHNIEYAEVTR